MHLITLTTQKMLYLINKTLSNLYHRAAA